MHQRPQSQPDSSDRPGSLAPDCPATLAEALCWRAQRTPQNSAVTFLLDGELQHQTWSFVELDRRAREVAGALLDRRAAGQRVLVALNPGLDYVAAVYGCLYSGAVAVPAYPPDPYRLNRTLPRLQAIMVDAQASLVLANDELLGSLQTMLPGTDCVGMGELGGGAALSAEMVMPSGHQLALLQYTSGSTGSPRGVMITHAHLLENCRAMHLAMDVPDATAVVWLPPYHDMGLIGGLFLPVNSGRHSVLMSPLHFMQRPLRWLQAMDRFRATSTGSPNFGLEQCVRKIADKDLEGLDLSSVQVCVTGAERVRGETIDRFIQRFGKCGFRREAIMPAYGLAEATLMVTSAPRGAGPWVERFQLPSGMHEPAAPDGDGVSLVSCGRPVDNVQVVIVDPQTRAELPSGYVGEIWVGSPAKGLGYWNQRAASREIFEARLAEKPPARIPAQRSHDDVHTPASDGAPVNNGAHATSGSTALLRTGDLGFLHEGQLFVAGRLKELMILGGRNYFPQDIEAAVAAESAFLKTDGGAAFAIDGEQGEQLVLVHEVQRPKKANLTQLVGALAQTIIHQFEIRPAAVVLIPAGSLPKTSSGKTRRGQAKKQFLADRLPELVRWPPRVLIGAAARAPLADGLLRLAELWEQVLGAAPNHPEDDFFALGGQSLDIAQLLHLLQQETGRQFNPRLIFHHSSLRAMAAAVEAAAPEHLSEPSGRARSSPNPVPDRGGQSVLSFAEARFWLLDQLGAGGSLSHIAAAWTLEGPLEPSALERALHEIVTRHRHLRTFYPTHNGEPRAQLAEAPNGWLRWIDLSDLALDLRIERWRQLQEDDVQSPLPLDQAPLWRFLAVRLSTSEHRLQWTLHHCLCDGGGLEGLLNELAEVLSGRAAASVSTIEYRDWACAERSAASGEHWRASAAYWRQRLADAPRSVDGLWRTSNTAQQAGLEAAFATDKNRTLLRREKELASLASRISDVSARHRVTPYLFHLAVFALVLARRSGADDLSIAVPVTLRRPDTARLPGCLLNTMVARVQVGLAACLQELLDHLREEAVCDWEYADAPVEVVVDAVQVDRKSLNTHPLADVMLAYQGSSRAPAGWGKAQLTELEAHYGGFGAFDMTLVIEPAAPRDRLKLCLLFNPQRLAAADAEAFLDEYAEVAQDLLLRDPQSSWSSLPLPSAADRQRLQSWNGTQRDGQAVRIDALLEARANTAPDAQALWWRGQSWSIGWLAEKSRRMAAGLQARGVQCRDRVLMAVDRSPLAVAAMWAIWRCNAIYTPVDVRQPATRVRRQAADCQPALCLWEPSEDSSCGGEAQFPLLDYGRASLEELLQSAPAAWSEPRASTDAAAYLIYTSGSTGEPKGVITPHRAVWNLLRSFERYPGFKSGQSLLAHTTWTFDISLLELLLPLCTGGVAVLADQQESQDAHALKALLESHPVDVVQATPTALRWLMLAGWRPNARTRTWSGGESLPADLASDLLGSGEELWNLYGPTETTVWSTLRRVDDPSTAHWIGRPIDNTQAYVLDRRGQLLVPGAVGELYLGGEGLAMGYWNAAELTRQKFATHRLNGQEVRLYRTGDLVRWTPCGQLEYLGRADQQVKIRGHRIELGEIETALREHPRVADACVIAVEDRWGPILAGYYVPTDGLTSADAPQIAERELQLKQHLAQRLPEAMMPASLTAISELPRSAAGKLDRGGLPRPTNPSQLNHQPAPPTTSLQRRIAAVWSEVLQRPVDDIRSSFFLLGGNSLLAMQVFARLHHEYAGERPPVAAFYRHPTIEGMADAIIAMRMVGRADAETLLAELESMTETEARRLLEQ